MPDFPFEKVHEHFARPLVGMRLHNRDLPPMLAIVNTDWENVVTVRLAPPSRTFEFFSDASGKAMLGQYIRESVAQIGDNPWCLVLISEAYCRSIAVEDKNVENLKVGKIDISTDPEASEIVMIQIFRPEGVRTSMLPISSSRVIEYGELRTTGISSGRFSLTPDEDDLPNGERFH